MRILLTCLLSAVVASHGSADVPVKIEDATSPDGRYQLEAIGVGENEGCRVLLKSLPKGDLVGRFSHADFQASDSRYHISAVWNKDSSAFALNIGEGRNITVPRVFVANGGSWNEANLPEKAIDRVRAKANTKDGKFQDYFSAKEWMPGNKLKFTYQGNTGEEYDVICRLVGGAKPRLAFVETIAPEAEPEPARARPLWSRRAAGQQHGLARKLLPARATWHHAGQVLFLSRLARSWDLLRRVPLRQWSWRTLWLGAHPLERVSR
jgi:hypothetical protein